MAVATQKILDRKDTAPPVPLMAESLNRRFQAGQAAAFDELVERHQEQVLRLASRLLGWRAEAQDVAQEVFLAALNNHQNFRGQSNLETWLTRITINKCRDYNRKHWLRLKLRQMPESAPPPPPGRELERSEQAAAVRQAVQKLPQKYREVLMLRYLQGLEINELTVMLGLSRRVVDLRLSRGRALLRKELKDHKII